MSRVAINTGSVANDGTGDSLRIAGGIINDNFSEIYSQFGDGTNLTPTWDKTAAGINTTSSVGIGTTNPRFTLEVGAVGSSGTSLWVNGNARVTGILTVGSSSIILDGNANKILVGSGISFDGNTGIISATAFYAGGSIISGGGGGGSGDSYWGSSASGISTTANVAIGTVTPTSKLTVVGNSLFSGIATFRSNLTLANLTSSSNLLRFGSNSYIDQSNSDVFTFQINSGTNGSGTDSSFVFRTTEPGASPVPDQAYDALRVYSGGDYWNRLVRVYTNFHADNDAFVGGDLQVGAASTLIGAGSTLGSFKVGAGGTVITTTSAGLVGIGITNPTSALTVGAVGAVTTNLVVNGFAKIDQIVIKNNSSSGYQDNIIMTQHPAVTFAGNRNVAIGDYSFTTPGAAGENVAIGYYALNVLGNNDIYSTYSGNTALGCFSGESSTYTLRNTLIGYKSGQFITTGDTNTILGAYDGNQNGLDIRTSDGNVVLSDGNGNIRFYANSSGNVGLGTTNPTSALTVKGDTSLETLSVSGVSTFTIGGAGNTEAVYFQSKTQPQASLKISQAAGNDYGVLMTFSSSDGETATIETDSNSNLIIATQSTLNLRANTNQTVLQSSGSSVDLYYSGTKKFETTSTGVSVGGTISVDGGVQLVTNNPTIVGTGGTTGEIKQIGGAPFYYDGSAWREFVLSSGTPVSVPADTEWDDVVLRTTFDTDFTDAKFGVTPVKVGTGSTTTGSPVKFGTGSYRNDGSVGAGISFAYRNDYDFTGPWTIEFWYYHDADPNINTPVSLVSMNSYTDGSGNWALALFRDGSANMRFYWYNQNLGASQTLYYSSGLAFSGKFDNKWVHLALVRQPEDGSLHFYVDGYENLETAVSSVIDNNILNINGAGLGIGGNGYAGFTAFSSINNGQTIDAYFDDIRITTDARYTSVGIATTVFTPPTTALPTTGTLSSYIQPPGDKYGEITLGGSPTWRGTSGVTVSQQSSGNYRVSFASTYTDSNDYYVLSQGMDQGFASYVGIARSITHVDLSINKQSDDTAVDTGALAVQIKNHI
jgi:hypothetical protein